MMTEILWEEEVGTGKTVLPLGLCVSVSLSPPLKELFQATMLPFVNAIVSYNTTAWIINRVSERCLAKHY